MRYIIHKQEVLFKSYMITAARREDTSARDVAEAVKSVFCHSIAILRQQVTAFIKVDLNSNWKSLLKLNQLG